MFVNSLGHMGKEKEDQFIQMLLNSKFTQVKKGSHDYLGNHMQQSFITW